MKVKVVRHVKVVALIILFIVPLAYILSFVFDYNGWCRKFVIFSVDAGSKRYLISSAVHEIEKFMSEKGYKKFSFSIGTFWTLSPDEFDFIFKLAQKRYSYLKGITWTPGVFMSIWTSMMEREVLEEEPNEFMEEEVKNLLLSLKNFFDASRKIIMGEKIPPHEFADFVENIVLPQTRNSIFLEKGYVLSFYGEKIVIIFENTKNFFEAFLDFLKIIFFRKRLEEKLGVHVQVVFLPFINENKTFRQVVGAYPYPFCVKADYSSLVKQVKKFSSIFLWGYNLNVNEGRKRKIKELEEKTRDVLNSISVPEIHNGKSEKTDSKSDSEKSGEEVENLIQNDFGLFLKSLGDVQKIIRALYQLGVVMHWVLRREKILAERSLLLLRLYINSNEKNYELLFSTFSSSLEPLKIKFKRKFMLPQSSGRDFLVLPKLDILRSHKFKNFFEKELLFFMNGR